MSPEQSQYIWRKTIPHIEVGMGSGVFTSHRSARFVLISDWWTRRKMELLDFLTRPRLRVLWTLRPPATSGSKLAPYVCWLGEEGISIAKDSIQPQVPLRLPCYDFTPVEDPTVVCANKTTKSLCGTSGTQKSWVIIGPMLRAKPIPRVWRAVCTGPGYIFTAACWSAITSDSNFMFPSCREQSELRQSFRIRSALQPCFPL